MPIIKSAIKKVRKDKVRTARNKRKEAVLKTLLKQARLNASAENLQLIFSALDKAVKTNLIPKNRASRLKSRLTKTGTQSEQPKTAPKKSSKKSSPKKASK